MRRGKFGACDSCVGGGWLWFGFGCGWCGWVVGFEGLVRLRAWFGGLWRPRLGWEAGVWSVVFFRSRAISHRLSRPTPGRDASGGPPGAPARRAASLRGERGTLDWLRCCLWFRSGSLVASLRLRIPRRSAGVKSMPLRWGRSGGGFVWHGLDTVGPSWAAVCADATRDPEPTSYGVSGHGPGSGATVAGRRRSRHRRTCRNRTCRAPGTRGLKPAAAGMGEVVRDRCPDPTEGRFRIPRRVGGRSQSARCGGVQPDGTAPQQRVIRLDSTRPG